MTTKPSPEDENAEARAQATAAALAALDANTQTWCDHVGWKEQLDQLAQMSAAFAGGRAKGPSGAELRMLILRQRSLIDRWVRQAFAEGFLAGDEIARRRFGVEP